MKSFFINWKQTSEKFLKTRNFKSIKRFDFNEFDKSCSASYKEFHYINAFLVFYEAVLYPSELKFSISIYIIN